MPLNVAAPEFKPTRSAALDIPLPADPWGLDDISGLSPEDALELEEVQSWVEMMADFEESEGDHLIALAMRYADKQHIHDLKQGVSQMVINPNRNPAH